MPRSSPRKGFWLKEIRVVEKPYLENRLRQTAFNSNHWVWLLTSLDYFESNHGHIFAYQIARDVLFIALEPLPPLTSPVGADDLFTESLAELRRFANKQIVVIIGVYEPCMRALAHLGFTGLRVGSDPWVHLEPGGPKGNKAKGIRSARNQALRAGVEISEWSLADLATDPVRSRTIKRIHDLWGESTWLRLEGFLLASDPLRAIEGRRLFVAHQGGQDVAFLLTSPVRLGFSSYFEDMMFTPDAPNGSTEMLMLHAMEALRLSGQVEVSLGVVALNNLGFYEAHAESAVSRGLLKVTKRVAQGFYNSAGIELHRKRYQPVRWDDTFVACSTSTGRLNLLTWIRILLSVVGLFNPRVSITAPQVWHVGKRWFYSHALRLAWLAGLYALAWRADYGVKATIVLLVFGLWSLQSIAGFVRGRSLRVTVAIAFVGSEILRWPPLKALLDRGPVGHLPEQMSLEPFWPALVAAGVVLQFISRRRHLAVMILALMVPLLFELKLGHPEILAERVFPFVFLAAGFAIGKVHFELYRRASEKHSKAKKPPLKP